VFRSFVNKDFILASAKDKIGHSLVLINCPYIFWPFGIEFSIKLEFPFRIDKNIAILNKGNHCPIVKFKTLCRRASWIHNAGSKIYYESCSCCRFVKGGYGGNHLILVPFVEILSILEGCESTKQGNINRWKNCHLIVRIWGQFTQKYWGIWDLKGIKMSLIDVVYESPFLFFQNPLWVLGISEYSGIIAAIKVYQ